MYIGPVHGFLRAASSSSSVQGPAETVIRPDPGLARGMWEAPSWLFFGLAAIAVVATVLYFLRRTGLLRLRRGAQVKR